MAQSYSGASILQIGKYDRFLATFKWSSDRYQIYADGSISLKSYLRVFAI